MTNEELDLRMAKLCELWTEDKRYTKLPHVYYDDGLGLLFLSRFDGGEPWRPTSNIQQCFDYVVPKMREMGWHFHLLCNTRDPDEPTYNDNSEAAFWRNTEAIEDGEGVIGDKGTEALLICQAALKAWEEMESKT